MAFLLYGGKKFSIIGRSGELLPLMHGDFKKVYCTISEMRFGTLQNVSKLNETFGKRTLAWKRKSNKISIRYSQLPPSIAISMHLFFFEKKFHFKMKK